MAEEINYAKLWLICLNQIKLKEIDRLEVWVNWKDTYRVDDICSIT